MSNYPNDYPYMCQCMGHFEGNRTFYKKHPDFYTGQGQNTPKNCESCKKWVKSQADEEVTCKCGTKFGIRKERKISIFKREGPYEPITQCGSCLNGNPPEHGTSKRPDRNKRDKDKKPQERKNPFRELKLENVGIARPVNLNIEDYLFTRIKNGKIGMRETRYVHLGHHIPGSPYDWTDDGYRQVNGIKGPCSPTSLVDEGATVEELVSAVDLYMELTDDTLMRDYTVPPKDPTKPPRIARVTMTGTHQQLELTILEEAGNGTYTIVSSYDRQTPDMIRLKDFYRRLP